MENLAATLLLFVVLCCQQSVQAQDNVCTKATSDPSHCICDTPNGRIDVTSIGNADKTPKWTNLYDPNQYPYDFNPCYGFSVTGCSNAVACQSASDGMHDCGDISTGTFYYDGSVGYIQYTNGEGDRITQVNLICDKSVDEPQATAKGDSNDRLLFYEFDVTTKCACPNECASAPGVAAGEVGISFIFITIGVVAAYFIIGALVMHFVFHKNGVDIIPQKDFWFTLPKLIKEGFLFTINPILSLVGRGRGGGKDGYSEL